MAILVERVLVSVGSLASIGLGVWHFSVPSVWKWDSYIDPRATELFVAIRAINIFFSLSLVLFGLVNVFLIFGRNVGKYSLVVVLAATCVLWLTRVVVQVIRPQGSMRASLQYGMLSLFVVVFLCYLVAMIAVLMRKGSI